MKTYIIDEETYNEITGYDPEDEGMLSPEEMGLVPIDRGTLLGMADELDSRAAFSETAPTAWLKLAAMNIRKAIGAEHA